jgi:hypothetical protein
MWLYLSDNAYYFGENAVNRIEPIDHRMTLGNTQVQTYKTHLYNNNVKVGSVKEEVQDILKRIGLVENFGKNE